MEPVGIGLIGIGNIGKEVFSYLRGVEDVRVLRIARRRVNAPAPATQNAAPSTSSTRSKAASTS